jgi:hypothetical protein
MAGLSVTCLSNGVDIVGCNDGHGGGGGGCVCIHVAVLLINICDVAWYTKIGTKQWLVCFACYFSLASSRCIIITTAVAVLVLRQYFAL